MNKEIVQIPGGKNEVLERERKKMETYQTFYDSFMSINKSKKKTIPVKIIGIKRNVNLTQPELIVSAVCEFSDSGWQVIVPAGYMGFAESEFNIEGMTREDKINKYKGYIKKMVGCTIDVVVVRIKLDDMMAAGNRKMAMDDIVERNYFRSDKNGESLMERAFRNGKFVQARVVTIARSVVWVDVLGYVTPVLARNVEWRFTQNLKDVVHVGEVVNVKIMSLEVDKENHEIKNFFVSIKDAQENMMKKNMDRYTIGSSFAGIVTGIHNGYYVQIGDAKTGIDVLCKVVNTYEMPNKGDEVLCTINIKEKESGRVYGAIDAILNRNTFAA